MPSEEPAKRGPKIYLWILKDPFRDKEKSEFQQWETTKALGSASVPVMRMISQVGIQGWVSTVGTRHKTCLSSRYPRSLVSHQRVPKLVSLEGTRDEVYLSSRYTGKGYAFEKICITALGTHDENCLSSWYRGGVVSNRRVPVMRLVSAVGTRELSCRTRRATWWVAWVLFICNVFIPPTVFCSAK